VAAPAPPFIADSNNHRVRRVDMATGVIATVAGNGASGFSGDGDSATVASLNLPGGVAVDTQGNLFIADSANHRIRKVGPDGIITTAAGNGTEGFSGDGGPAADARLNRPTGVAVDAQGNLFVADSANHRIRQVHPGVSTIQWTPAPVPTATPTATPVPAPVIGSPGSGGDGAGGGGVSPQAPTPEALPTISLGPAPEIATPAVVSPTSIPAPAPVASPPPPPTVTPAPTATPTGTPMVLIPTPGPPALDGRTDTGLGPLVSTILVVVGLFLIGGLIGLMAVGMVFLTQAGRIQWSREFWRRQMELRRIWLEHVCSRRLMAPRRR
jgi:hypothetical protein